MKSPLMSSQRNCTALSWSLFLTFLNLCCRTAQVRTTRSTAPRDLLASHRHQQSSDPKQFVLQAAGGKMGGVHEVRLEFALL